MYSNKKLVFGLLFAAASSVSASEGVFFYNVSGSDWTGVCATVSIDRIKLIHYYQLAHIIKGNP